MAELLAVAQTFASPEAATPESEQRRETESGRSVPTAAEKQRTPHDELQHAVGNSAVQHMAADPPEVSRPADPGQGPGLDVVFVFKSSPEDPPEQREYIRDMTSFVQSALPGERLYEVDDLDGLLVQLFVMGADGEPVRRLRIVGHGSHDRPGEAKYTHGGKVLTHDPGGRPTWIGADVVRAAARDPGNISVMNKVMTPDAVVEFWGCSLGGYEKSGQAWAALFHRPVAATTGHLEIDPWRYWILLAPVGSRRRGTGEREVTDAAGRRWLAKSARTSAEVDKQGSQASRGFDEFLFVRYQSLVADGQIPSVAGDRSTIVSHMRRMFDAQHGAIHELAVSTPSGPVGPGQRARWNRLWRVFEPQPIGPAVRSPDKQPGLPKPKPKPGLPKAKPGLPKPGASKTTGRSEPVLSEKAWADRHPAGRTERTGEDAWALWNFDIGRSGLKQEHTRQLDAISTTITASAAAGTVRVSVEGYASASGPPAFNLHLSIARAARVAAYLRQRLGHAAVIAASGHGIRGPQTPGQLEDSAGSRRVEVRITSPVRPSPPVREPLPSPIPAQSAGWQAVGSADQKQGKALADYLPGYSIEGKFSGELPGFPLGTDWLLVGGVELGLKLEFTTKVPVTVANSLKEGKWDYQIKTQFADAFTVSANPKEGKISLRFDEVLLKPEIEAGIGDLLSKPELLMEKIAKNPDKLFKVVSIKLTIPMFEPKVDLGQRIPALAGIGVKLKLQPKVIVSLVPSEVMLLRMAAWLASRAGAAGGPIVAGVIGGVGYTILALYLIDQAHKRGERWADVVNFRRAYARRLAAEAADWRPGRGIASTRGWDEASKEMLNARYHGGAPATAEEKKNAALFERTYTQGYEGWQSAEAALRLLQVDQYDATMEALRKRFGTAYGSLQEAIFNRIGGASEDPIVLPANIAELR
jgi:outer membrane protein OmpA-like peptidoglycan-associated protein